MNKLSALKYLLLIVLAISLTACQATRRTLNFNTSAELNFIAQNNINPDSDDRSSPVVVRVFKLADDRQFSREDFLNLYENADDRLGRDLLDTIILKELAPGEKRTETLALTEDVKYIGLLAEFVQYEDADAILVLPITDHKENDFKITIDGTSLYSGEHKQVKRPKSTSSSQNNSSVSREDIEQTRDDAYQLKEDKDALQEGYDSF